MTLHDLVDSGDRWRATLDPPLDESGLRKLLNAPIAHKRRYACIHHGPQAAGHAIKLIRPRSVPRDSLRKFLTCQARREFDAARRLSQWNIPCVAVHGWALNIMPCTRLESLLIMQYRPHCHNARRYLEQCPQRGDQWALLSAIADDVATIYGHGYHHHDCHLGNILVDGQGRRSWLDNELRWIPQRAILFRHLDKTLSLLERSIKQAVNPQLRRDFRQACLARTNAAYAIAPA